MLKFRDLSTTQQVSAIFVIAAFPLLCVATRLWSGVPAIVLLPFAYPVAVMILAWSLTKTEARVMRERQDPAPPAAVVGLGLGAPSPSRLGGRISVAAQFAILLIQTQIMMFPRLGPPDVLVIAYMCWAIGASAFMLLAFHRLLPSITSHGG